MRISAKTEHVVPDDPPPLQLVVGEVVSVGARSIEWPAFVFVQAANGTGWVPWRYLSSDRGPATVRVPYDTKELPLVGGQDVEVLQRDDVSEWWWCRSADGEEGWVPITALDLDGS